MKYSILLVLLISSLCISGQDITQGVIGHWLMNDDEVLDDQSSTELEGYVFEAQLTQDRFGNEDEALFFDGVANTAVFEDALDEVFAAVDAQFAISLWYKTSDFFPGLSPLICKYSHTGCGQNERQWALMYDGGFGIRFYFAATPDNLNYRSVTSTDNLVDSTNTWYHIVVNYDGAQDGNDGQDRVQIYIDNIAQGDTLGFTIGELGESINDGNAPIGLMSYVNTSFDNCGEYNAIGSLDDLRIYDRLLLDSEVEALFLEGVVGLSENEVFSNSISVGPNPLKGGMLTVTSDRIHQGVSIEVMTPLGQRVLAKDVGDLQGQYQLPLEGLSKGVYHVRFISDTGAISVKKIMVL